MGSSIRMSHLWKFETSGELMFTYLWIGWMRQVSALAIKEDYNTNLDSGAPCTLSFDWWIRVSQGPSLASFQVLNMRP